MDLVKFGFVGAGQIASWSAREIKNHPRGVLVAAQDLDAGRLRQLCDEEKIPKAYATARELFADQEIDVVYIAVPNKFHIPLTLEALQAGKHVILEKPFAMNYTEALQASEAARKAGKILMLGMNQRFGGNPQKIRTLIAQGALGEIYHAKAFWMRRAGIPRLGTWFGNHALSGGGCLYDIGVHMLDLCLYLMDNFKPATVSGATYTKFGNRGLGEGGWGKSDRANLPFDVDDFTSGFIRLENGATVSLDVSWACHTDARDRNDVHLFGTEGGAHACAGLLFRPDGSGYSVIQEPIATPAYTHGSRFHNFINHMTKGESLCVTIDQALTIQKILDALALSSKTGNEVSL